MGEFLKLESTTIDGVETFWTDVARPTMTATLVFRAGMADETLTTSGWLHLLEHLAVHGRDTPTLAVNASVGLLQTRFDLAGPAAEVAAALSDLTLWFAEPELSKVPEEARVLRAESEWRGTSPAGAAMLERFGAVGPGLAGHSEPGLSRVHPAALRELCRKYFTSGNAALALNGPPPADLRLHLPHGFRMLAPPAIELPGPKPAAYAHGKDGVVASGIVPRTVAATILPNVMQRAFHEKLRNMEGAAYAPWSVYEPVDEERAVIVVGSDFRQELHPRLMELTRGALNIARNPDWLEKALQDLKASHRQAHADPRSAEAQAVRSACQALRGQPLQSWEQVLEEFEAITLQELGELVTTFHQTLLLGVPGEIPWNNELPLNQMGSDSVMEGRSRRSRAFLVDRGNLTIGPQGVSISSPTETRTVPFTELEGVYAYGDGARMLIRRDGWFITVEPTLWKDGERAVADVDAATSLGPWWLSQRGPCLRSVTNASGRNAGSAPRTVAPAVAPREWIPGQRSTTRRRPPSTASIRLVGSRKPVPSMSERSTVMGWETLTTESFGSPDATAGKNTFPGCLANSVLEVIGRTTVVEMRDAL